MGYGPWQFEHGAQRGGRCFQKPFSNAEAAFQALSFWDKVDSFQYLSGEQALEHRTLLEASRKPDLTLGGYGREWTAMLAVLRQKFQRGSPYAKALRRTKDALLVEHWCQPGDPLWSDDSTGDGKNWNGLQLMLVRDELNSTEGVRPAPKSWTAFACDVCCLDLKTGLFGSAAGAEKWQVAVRAATTKLLLVLKQEEDAEDKADEAEDAEEILPENLKGVLVNVDGRSGRVVRDLRPEYQFVSVEWPDAGGEPEMVPVANVRLSGRLQPEAQPILLTTPSGRKQTLLGTEKEEEERIPSEIHHNQTLTVDKSESHVTPIPDLLVVDVEVVGADNDAFAIFSVLVRPDGPGTLATHRLTKSFRDLETLHRSLAEDSSNEVPLLPTSQSALEMTNQSYVESMNEHLQSLAHDPHIRAMHAFRNFFQLTSEHRTTARGEGPNGAASEEGGWSGLLVALFRFTCCSGKASGSDGWTGAGVGAGGELAAHAVSFGVSSVVPPQPETRARNSALKRDLSQAFKERRSIVSFQD